MRRDDLEEILSRLAHGPSGEPPKSFGRVPEDVARVILALFEPGDLDPGDISLTIEGARGPGYEIGDALLAHPDGVAATICRGVAGFEGEAVGTVGRSALRKIAVFVPRTHLDSLRDAISEAGAGHIGNYRDCTFSSEGTGSFVPLEGADPFIGQIGEREYVAESRLESVYPAYLESRVLAAMRSVHPYEEIAYDIYDLRNQEPTYGATRLVDAEEMTAEELAQEVRLATGANEVSWCSPPGSRPRLGRVLVSAGAHEDLVSLAAAHRVHAVVAERLSALQEDRLLDSGVTLVRVRDLWLSGLHQFAARLENEAGSLPVVLWSGGYRWQSPRA